MKILVAEVAHHHKVLENTYKLLDLNCAKAKITMFVNRDRYSLGKNERELLFKDAHKVNWIIHKFHFSTFFIRLLFLCRKYDLINIATGPEDIHFTNIINAIFFYLCTIIYKNKIILTVKNLRPYLSSTKRIQSFILNMTVVKTKVITFETETLKKKFHEETKIPLCKLCVSYDRYTDLYNEKFNYNAYFKDNKKYKIGLLGGIELHRRNYFQIIDALNIVPKKIRNNMLFITLGQCRDKNSMKILMELEKLVEVNYIRGFISSEEFDIRGSVCNLLISPLKKSLEYGTYKGSGSFGDAVYLRKKIIIPTYVDPLKEFNEISFYYEDVECLAKLFKNIDQIVNLETHKNFYNKFSSKKVFNNIKKVALKQGMFGY